MTINFNNFLRFCYVKARELKFGELAVHVDKKTCWKFRSESFISFEVYCRSDSDSPTLRYGESIIALDLYVCLFLQPSLVPWNRFLGSLNVYKYGLRLHWLAKLVPWNWFLGSITWRTKTKTIFLDRNEYIRSSTIKGTKNNKFICS